MNSYIYPNENEVNQRFQP